MNKSGLSLVEVILAAALFAVLMVTVNLTLMNTLKSSRRVEASTKVKNEGEALINRMAKDIEFSSAMTTVCPFTGNSIAFTRGNDALTPVTYSLFGTQLMLDTVAMSSTAVLIRNYLPDCPSVFSCSGDTVTICFGAEINKVGTDISDTASGSGGLKFYRRVVRRNTQ